MPIRCILDKELNLVYIADVGHTTGREFTAFLETLKNLNVGTDKVDFFVDLRANTAFDLDRNDDIDEIIRRGQIANTKFEASRVACVTQKNEDETLYNLFGSLFGEEDATKSKVFPTLGEALEWLGRPGTEAQIEKLRHHLFPASALST